MRGVYKKRGLSPVIATVLLIAIALVLALIIFIWARSFISEKTQKFDKPISEACTQINFVAEVGACTGSGTCFDIQNNGNVPIYGVELRKKGGGTIESIKTFDGATTIGVGQRATTNPVDSTNVASGDTVTVIPIIIGTQGEEKKTYACDSTYGKDVQI